MDELSVPEDAADESLLTGEAAKILDVTPSTVRWWDQSGKLQARRTPSGFRLFSRRRVEQLAAQRAAHKRAVQRADSL